MRKFISNMGWYCLGGATFGGPQWLYGIAIGIFVGDLIILTVLE